MRMTGQAQRVLGEFVQANEPDLDQKLAEGLAAVMSELVLPPAFQKRLEAALAEAARKTFREHDGHAAHPAVSVRVMVSQADSSGAHSPPNWGFFLIERSEPETARHTIELFVYRDKR